MKTHSTFLSLALGLALPLLAACTGGEAPSAPPSSAPSRSVLDAVHEAYLAGDWLALGERVREVLLDPAAGRIAHDNALDVLDKAYEETHGALPSRSVLPASVGWAQYFQQHVVARGERLEYAGFFVRVKKGTALRALVLTRLPNTVILDLGAGLGRLEKKDVVDGFDDLSIQRDIGEALGSGVLSARLEVEGEPPVDVWFPIRGGAATGAPEIRLPEETSERRPTLHFAPMHAPEDRSFEQRTINLWVGKERRTEWNFWKGDPGELDRVTVEVPLEPGDHWLSITAGARRRFGPIEIERAKQRGQRLRILP